RCYNVFCIVILLFVSVSFSFEIHALSLHDALPISSARWLWSAGCCSTHCSSDCRRSGPSAAAPPRCTGCRCRPRRSTRRRARGRSEEHTSELQSRENLVCRLLLEKKKKR